MAANVHGSISVPESGWVLRLLRIGKVAGTPIKRAEGHQLNTELQGAVPAGTKLASPWRQGWGRSLGSASQPSQA